LVRNIRSIIVEVSLSQAIFSDIFVCLACGHVFCDTCTTNRRIIPWIDTEKPVRVCNICNDNPKPRALSITTEVTKQLSQKSYENGSSGESASTVSSGEHLNDLCLSPTDIFDIDQPGAGKFLVFFLFDVVVRLIKVQSSSIFQQQDVFMKLSRVAWRRSA
jgi:hypothetical protein